MEISLHEKQQAVISSKTRFTVWGAGRRGGKTWCAAVWLFIESMKEEREGVNYGPQARVLYVAPTLGLADDLMVDMFKAIAGDYIQDFNVKKLQFTMKNGRRVKLAGCDKPRSLRGGSIIALVMDEVQDIKINEVWNRVLRPACGDLKAPCLFIGTPLPGTSEDWHDLYKMGLDPKNDAWSSFHSNSTQNTFIDMASEVEQARKDGVSEAIIQSEFFASFELMSSSHFDLSSINHFSEVPPGATTYISVDLHGFGDLEGLTLAQVGRLDETAISVVSVCTNGHWYIHQIKHGRWPVAETAKNIAKLCFEFKPRALGVESGVLHNAIRPYLETALRDLNIFLDIKPLTHGNKRKVDRMFWALQGRFERGMIHVPFGRPAWVAKLKQQLSAVPSRAVHDDLPDSLSYIDALAEPTVTQAEYEQFSTDTQEAYEPLDDLSGY